MGSRRERYHTDPEYRAKRLAAMKAYYARKRADPEFVAKARAKGRQYHQSRKADPEYVARKRRRENDRFRDRYAASAEFRGKVSDNSAKQRKKRAVEKAVLELAVIGEKLASGDIGTTGGRWAERECVSCGASYSPTGPAQKTCSGGCAKNLTRDRIKDRRANDAAFREMTSRHRAERYQKVKADPAKLAKHRKQSRESMRRRR